MEALSRCAWCGNDPLYMKYHDTEWGVPVHNDRKLFEMLILEGAQAGLSWITILRKRQNYRKAFCSFNPAEIAAFDSRDVKRLLKDEGIVRNRLKIEATVSNARAFLAIKKEWGSFDNYIWQFVGGSPITNHWNTSLEIPSMTAESNTMSRDLKRHAFKFVGSTICYAFMQSVGMVNDHVVSCFRHDEIRHVG